MELFQPAEVLPLISLAALSQCNPVVSSLVLRLHAPHVRPYLTPPSEGSYPIQLTNATISPYPILRGAQETTFSLTYRSSKKAILSLLLSTFIYVLGTIRKIL